MPRIRLTYWWDGHAPGDVVEVSPESATALIGRIAVAEPDERPAGDADRDRSAAGEA